VRNPTVLAIAFALVVACPLVHAQAPAAKSADTAAATVANGKRAFTSAGCVACHGAQGQGTAMGIQIAPPPFELPALITYVRQPTGKMPPFAPGAVSDQQLADIYAFLKSVAPPPSATETLTGNADNGKKLFAAYGCYECHGRQGAGAGTGPRRSSGDYARGGSPLRPRAFRPDAALHHQSRLRSGPHRYLHLSQIAAATSYCIEHPTAKSIEPATPARFCTSVQ